MTFSLLSVVQFSKNCHLLLLTNKMKIALALFMLIYLCFKTESQTVKVVEFNDYSALTTNPDPERTAYLGPLMTKSLTICFRFKARYNEPQMLIKTKQLSLNLKETTKGQLWIHPLNTISVFQDIFYAIFSYSSTPGKWTSLCLGISITDVNLRLKVFQNGKLTWDKLYSDSTGVEFDPIFYKEETPLKEM